MGLRSVVGQVGNLRGGWKPRAPIANWRAAWQAAPPVLLLAAVTLAVFATHAPFLNLPYFWDEAGHFIPAARDLLELGRWIPVSTPPNIHPPGVVAFLALAWKLAGYSLVTTRVAMLVLASSGLLATFLLARELGATGYQPYLATLLLFISPLFFAQAMLAQLDAPAMLFTALALLFFLRGAFRESAAVCVVLILVKETGLIVPLVFAAVLIKEHRRREASWFALPGLLLAVWIAVLSASTGHWAGSSDFASYNLRYLLDPFRLTVSLLRRIYYLLFANFHWIGTVAIVLAWRRGRCLETRPWRIVLLFAVAHVTLVALFGGASLERYLLPIMPLFYAAMATSLATQPPIARAIGTSVLAAGLAAGNWINPPYPFPYENNLALVDFIDIHKRAAEYLAHRCPSARINTVWPLTEELAHPKLGYVSSPLSVEPVSDLTARSLEGLDWRRVQVVVTFSRDWDCRTNVMHLDRIRSLWERHYGALPATRAETAAMVPFPLAAHFERRGQWVDIFVNPAFANGSR
jgi:hypothetical protein